jgi:phosphoglycolate phosphatase
VVVFDVDGTLLDSAPGIVAGFRHALHSVGFEAPDEATLRSDLGPPVGDIFTALGLPARDLSRAVHAYRRFYLGYGMQQSTPYEGIAELLAALRQAGVTLGTATAKRTNLARAILDHHDLSRYFTVVNGTDEQRSTKTATLDLTLHLLGRPNPAEVMMVGDRYSDVIAARRCGVDPVAVTWGYGTLAELQATGAPLIDQPQQLLELPLFDRLLPGRQPSV